MFRFKSIALLFLLSLSGIIQAIEPRTAAAIINTAKVLGAHAGIFIGTKIQRRWMLREVELYSVDELADLKRIVEPYVSTDVLNTIIGCIRKPTYFSRLSAPCSFNNLIIINPNIRLSSTCDLSDVEFAYLVLHEYGHVISGHTSTRKDITNVLKGLSLQLPLIALQLYGPQNINHAKIQQAVAWGYFFGTAFFTRRNEYVADDYAFNALKVDAPAGCVALEKILTQAHYTISQKISDKPSLFSRAKLSFFSWKTHPTIWSRYQHACKVAKKYGWKQEEQTIVSVDDIIK